MKENIENPPAFPETSNWNDGREDRRIYTSGMKLRDYFAGIAMGALIEKDIHFTSYDFIASRAYSLAEARLK